LTTLDEEKKQRIEYLENKVRRQTSQISELENTMERKLMQQKLAFEDQ
jgi:hypothetical protein